MKWKQGVSEVGMDADFMSHLRYAESASGFEWTITGAMEDHGDSEVDIRCHESVSRYRILRGLYFAGFTRIGIYDRHIHAGREVREKPVGVAWLGVSK